MRSSRLFFARQGTSSRLQGRLKEIEQRACVRSIATVPPGRPARSIVECTRKACEPLHVQYSYDDRGVVVINTSQQSADGLTVSAPAFDFSLEKFFAREVKGVDFHNRIGEELPLHNRNQAG